MHQALSCHSSAFHTVKQIPYIYCNFWLVPCEPSFSIHSMWREDRNIDSKYKIPKSFTVKCIITTWNFFHRDVGDVWLSLPLIQHLLSRMKGMFHGSLFTALCTVTRPHVKNMLFIPAPRKLSLLHWWKAKHRWVSLWSSRPWTSC